MALLRALTRRASLNSPITTTLHRNPSPTASRPSTEYAKNDFHRDYIAAHDGGTDASGFIRRFFHRRAPHPSSATISDLFPFPIVGEKLRDRLKGMSEPRLNLESVLPPPPPVIKEFSVDEARKLLRLSQAARLKSALREIPGNAIGYGDYIRLCVEMCGENEEQGRDLSKRLDESGDVIVLGSVVFTRPEQVVKIMADLVSQSMATPNDPRRDELEQMENQKAIIDMKACSLVRGELYCGLGFIVLQTLGIMRLTFWELSWDVMEPICFFVTSLHFAAAYAFFLGTSTEPSFEGFYKQRFKARQKKVMKAEGFNIDKYNELCKLVRYNFRGDLADQGCK